MSLNISFRSSLSKSQWTRDSSRNKSTSKADTENMPHCDFGDGMEQSNSMISGLENKDCSISSGPNTRRENLFDVCLRRTCLRPKFSLKDQLFLSFGIASTLCLCILVVTSILIILRSGADVSQMSREELEILIEERLSGASRVKAESITAYLEYMKGLPAILVETTKDRFAGYPDHPGYANDSLVPFKDMVSGRNVYPLKAKNLIPLDWEFDPVEITDKNADEYVRGRREWYLDAYLRGEVAMGLQGACNPKVTDPDGRGYFPNCTDANNDLSVGGQVQPTSTFQLIHEKASDYANAVLKPLYESHANVFETGIFFSNSGAGTYVAYPGLSYDGWSTYTSEGCDWLLEPNPYDTSRTIGTEEMVDRCHTNGTEVNTWFYNPMERAWCREQALNPFKVHFFGPYLDAYEASVLFTIGQAVYDRVTNEFIACTLADVSTTELTREIEQFKITNASEIHFVKWDDGVVVASSKWSAGNSSDTTTMSEIDSDLGVELFIDMKETFSASYHDEQTRSKFNPVRGTDNRVFAFFPVPVPPKTYDPDYAPEFAVVLSLAVNDVYAEVNALDVSVAAGVHRMIQNVLIAGLVGLLFVILSIYLVTMFLTKPMKWMTDIGDHIVYNLGSAEHSIGFENNSPWVHWSPRTEVTSLIDEFQKLVKEFSGKGTATLHSHRSVELKNPFDLHHCFVRLYVKRNDPEFKYKYDEQANKQTEQDNHDQFTSFSRIYWGPNLHGRDVMSSESSSHENSRERLLGKKTVLRSPLFWWILGAIAAPLLITMIAISIYVSISVSNDLPRLTQSVQDVFVDFEEKSLIPLARARAAFSARVIAPAFRDAHLLSRVSGWLFFGALQRSQSITSLTTAAEECKQASVDDLLSCSYVQNRTNTPCDCHWNQRSSVQSVSCFDYQQDSRYLQQLWWFGSSQEARQTNDFGSTSFPVVASSPENTSWWSDWRDVPGADLTLNATISNTTFEMLVYMSALSMVQIPLFNYQKGNPNPPTYSFTAFEDSGIFSGYSGCEVFHPFASQFQMNDSVSNGSGMNSTHCPTGMYGYDPRCTSWYQGGKLTHAANEGDIYVSPPSPFPFSALITQTIALPIYSGDRFLGQNAVDIQLTPILQALTQDETPLSGAGFHVLISTTKYNAGTEVVVGPGYDSFSGEKQSIVKSVLPYDECENGMGLGCDNLAAFQSILEDMRDGKSGTTRFTRRTMEGSTESVIWAFAPVDVDSFEHLNNSDILRGVANSSSTVFSVALASPEPALHDALNSFESELERVVRVGTSVLAATITLTLIGLSVLSAGVTVSVTKPISKLLHVLKKINKHEMKNDRDDVIDGSLEVKKVHQVIERLRTVLPVANAAFFHGDLRLAHTRLESALNLFQKLRNEKAIGVANNNLGNTMLSMYRTMKATSAVELAGLSLSGVCSSGESYFKCAIDGGERALARINEEEGWSTNYLIFMQQLSNRYFNRAMFFLVVKDDHPEPDEALRLGLMDLSTAKDMDREVVDNGDSQGYKGDRADYFELLLGRIKGIQYLMSLGYDDEWGIDDLFTDAFKEVALALREPEHALFRRVEPAGQMQRLDAVLIKYLLSRNETEMAALVGIRMLVEDDYVFTDTATWALRGLLKYLETAKEEDLDGEDPSDVRSTLFQYRQRIAETIAASSRFVRSDASSILMRESAKQSTQGDVSMELF